MIPGLVTKREDGEDYNGDLIAGAMTAGLWGGFGLGILMTRDSSPAPKYVSPPTGTPRTARSRRSTETVKAGSGATYLPFVGDRGQLGLMAGGTW